uniref:Ion transport N-terminal domain-containing protein n=1 Tax=Strigamia maritima TaxID=126957 RepID=T1JIT6_STRMM
MSLRNLRRVSGDSGDMTELTETTANTGPGAGGARGRRTQRVPSLKLANGRVGPQFSTPSEEEVRSPRSIARSSAGSGIGQTGDESVKISVDNTCTDSLVTALDEDGQFVSDYITPEMNFKDANSKVHFTDAIGEEASLYGTPKEELGPGMSSSSESKPSFIRNQLQNLFQPTDNKLAMKLFGSKKNLMKERIRQKQSGHWIIHPCSSFRFYWDLCMLLLLVANLIILPVAISFFNDDLSLRWIAFNCLSDTIFLIDIVVNFRTGKRRSRLHAAGLKDKVK